MEAKLTVALPAVFDTSHGEALGCASVDAERDGHLIVGNAVPVQGAVTIVRDTAGGLPASGNGRAGRSRSGRSGLGNSHVRKGSGRGSLRRGSGDLN